MAYMIRYGPEKTHNMRRLLLLSGFFFLVFVVTANLLFPAELAAMRDLIISQSVQDSVTTFCQELVDGTWIYAD